MPRTMSNANRRRLIEMSELMWRAKIAPDPRCPLVNPLCPSDLCELPAGHPGTEEGYHVLGTDAYDQPVRYVYDDSPMFLLCDDRGHPRLAPDGELCEAGWREQQRLFPETH